ncbi:MAG: hypothetical protein ACLUSP_00335 [Christensenellales bacterium]
MGLISFMTGSDNRRHIKRLNAIADKVERYEEEYKNSPTNNLKRKPPSLRTVSKTTTKLSTIFFPRRSQPSARQVGVSSA